VVPTDLCLLRVLGLHKVRLSQRVQFLKNTSGIKYKGIFWYNKRVYFGRISKQPKTEERLAFSRLAGTPCMRYPNNPTDFVVLLECRMPFLYFFCFCFGGVYVF
jgi:hypothetical protein